MDINILAIVQARMNSTRFPGKVLEEINNITLIEILFHRLSQAKQIDKIILATSLSKQDDLLTETIEKLGFEVFRGSENDVLERYYQAAKIYCPKVVVRITGDCPLIDPNLVDEIVTLYNENNLDYGSNTDPPTFPDGLDTEVFSIEALEMAHEQTEKLSEREHVTTFLRRNEKFKQMNYANKTDLSSERWTVDEPEDFEVIKKIINHFAPKIDFSWCNVIELKKYHPEYFKDNKDIRRNEGTYIGKGQKLWRRSKKIIPGGNMLLSKRPEMFLPDKWPSYYSRAQGCSVWDMDGNEYTDMSIMGVGTNILGYGHPEVDDAVRKAVDSGNMSTFNCPEEVYLAERMVELHPWSSMVRFARTGGEANAISIRIARAATGKSTVAICGYHGWHDWYLAANLAEETNLDSHLLAGLDPNGVPSELSGTVVTFEYNNIESLKKVLVEHDIGVIKMEVSRTFDPDQSFLESVKKIATKNNIVLVFDECTSGFRETFGGLHMKYGIFPDMAVFGKALGNGYAITAVLGTKEIMEVAQSSFISSTFWTERIGPVAGLKTLEIMEQERSWEIITKIGKQIGERWLNLAKKHNLPLKVNGLPALVSFTIPVKNWIKYKTLITQEMLKMGFLAANTIYVCIDHKQDLIDTYFDILDPIFSLISQCEEGKKVDELIEGPLCHTGFKRLN